MREGDVPRILILLLPLAAGCVVAPATWDSEEAPPGHTGSAWGTIAPPDFHDPTDGGTHHSDAEFPPRLGPSHRFGPDALAPQNVLIAPSLSSFEPLRTAGFGPEVLVGTTAVHVNRDTGRTTAVDLETGTWRWTKDPPEGLAPRVVVTDGTVVCGFAPAAGAFFERVRCLDLLNGVARLDTTPGHRVADEFPAPAGLDLALADGRLALSHPATDTAPSGVDVFDLAAGVLRFSAPCADRPEIVGGAVACPVSSPVAGSLAAFSLATGAEVARSDAPSAGEAQALWRTGTGALFAQRLQSGAKRALAFTASPPGFADVSADNPGLVALLTKEPVLPAFAAAPGADGVAWGYFRPPSGLVCRFDLAAGRAVWCTPGCAGAARVFADRVLFGGTGACAKSVGVADGQPVEWPLAGGIYYGRYFVQPHQILRIL